MLSSSLLIFYAEINPVGMLLDGKRHAACSWLLDFSRKSQYNQQEN